MRMTRTRPRAAPALVGVLASVVALAPGPALGQQPLSACTAITEPGSYVLTQNLTAAAGADCLELGASFVTIDLNGFALIGVGGPRAGISDRQEVRQGIAVRNGTVTGFGIGVSLLATDGAVVEEVRAIANDGNGILAGLGSIVSGNIAQGNEGAGISVADSSIVSGNTALDNGGVGIAAIGPGSTVSGNTAQGNDGAGILAGRGSTVSGNTVQDNGVAGISVGSGSTVSDNTALGNGVGIDAVCPSLVIGNTATTNSQANLVLRGPGCNDINNVAPGMI